MARTPTLTAEPAQPTSLDRLDDSAGTPLYEIVKRQLSQKILFGDWGPGTVLPAEIALAKDLGVAVGTVRHALLELVREGLVSRRRGIGTVVTSRTHHHNLAYYFQYFRLHGRDESLQHSKPRVVTVEIQPADARVAEKLQISVGTPVVRLHRVREVNDRPVIHDIYFFAAERAPDFPMAPEKVPSRLHIFFLEQYGIRVTAVRELLTAEIASEEDLKLLDLRHPAAVLSIEDVTFDQAGAPVVYSMRRASTQNHMYINEIK